MISLIALIALSIHLGLGWWTVAVFFAYAPILTAAYRD